MSAEPETRPFTNAELAHFLEQFELDRPVTASSVVATRAPRIVGTEPRTMLGMGGLPVPTTPLRGPARDTFRALPHESEPRALATPRGARALGAALGAELPIAARGPRSSSPPASAMDSSPTGSAWQRALRAERRPASVLGGPHARVQLVCAASIAAALFVAACWGAASIAGPRSAPSAVSTKSRSLRTPPPLPRVVTPPARAAQGTAAAVSAPLASSPTSPGAETLALPGLVLPSARSVDATSATRPASRQQVSPVHRAAPLGRLAARREAVDLLMAGHTRAALAAYRELPPTLRAEPALVQVIRLLERELRACDGPSRVGCGT